MVLALKSTSSHRSAAISDALMPSHTPSSIGTSISVTAFLFDFQ